GILIGTAGIPFGITTRMTAVGEALQWVPWNLEFASLLGFLLLAATGGWEKYAAPRGLTFFGDISYGLYLYHLFFFRAYDWTAGRTQFEIRLSLTRWEGVWLRMIVCSSVAILFSYISRWYFEEFFLRRKSRLDKASS